MTKKKACPVCHEVFPVRSYYRHVQKYFDNNTNAWLDHGNSICVPVPEVRQSQKRLFEELIDSSTDSEEEDASCYNCLHDDIEEIKVDDMTMDADGCDQLWGDSGSSTEEDDEPEHWDVQPEKLDEDLGIDEVASSVKSVNSFLFYFIYGILYLQVVHHISDNGVEFLLKFLFKIFQSFGLEINNQLLSEFCIAFPPSLYMARKLVKLDRDEFKKLVVCPSCHKLYEVYECIGQTNGVRFAKLCDNEVKKQGRYIRCNSSLMKEVICRGNSKKFYPIKVYCLNSIINGLETILKHKEIGRVWEHQKSWEDSNGLFRDVYDGRIWKKFQNFNSKPFLSDPNSIALMMNIDWFQPFKHRNDYSVGVIYFVILNLPRNIRFRSENVIIAGLIPSFQKEPGNINSFLEPIVLELKQLWNGVKLSSSIFRTTSIFRAALICVSCDIPAARKCCGFKSHAAKLGCNKCYKVFPGSFGEKRDYSGFDMQNWKPRSRNTHNVHARKVKNAKTKTEFDKLSKEYGVYYSVLIELEYFDAISFCVIDPMHNLFLGTAKKMFKLWVEKQILNPSQLDKIETRLAQVNSSTDIGRIPTHISGNYGVFSAAEWKNWTTVFSLYALCGILPDQDFKCWEKFVIACRILCKPFISESDILKAHSLLLNFCRNFEQIYDLKDVTCNMHLHCHLKECLIDYGPLHVFWCFSFERYNGTFGNYHTNNKAVEIQFMRKIMTTKFCETFHDKVLDTNDKFGLYEVFFGKGSLSDNRCNITDVVKLLRMAEENYINFLGFDSSDFISFPKVYKLAALTRDDIMLLMKSYRKMYPSVHFDISDFSEIIKKYGNVSVLGENFGSKQNHRKLCSANVLVNWVLNEEEVDIGHCVLSS